ncbi:alpha/beta hydrolase [Sphingomonas panacis]|uniref:alpha/beta hydrolase n=1 Tax=Sphingomonas panacis TaxID=1560345 RepID=UPI000AEE9818|nr:alpha/beta hydrolase [Sphingomonas panacis]
MDDRSSTAPEHPQEVARRYLEADGRAIHYRVIGDGPAVIMLHDSPRSSRLHLATMHALSRHFRVYALDTPGYGNSEPLGSADPTIADFATALDAVIRALGIEGAPIYATHTSAKIALEYAASRANSYGEHEAKRTGTAQTGCLILDGLSIPVARTDPAFISAYMRPFLLDEAGAYLAAEWTRMRDMVRWFPWFAPSPQTRMPTAQPTDAWISAYMIDFLSAGPNYSSAYAAAMRYDPMPSLMRVTSPVLVAARSDDVLYASLDRVPVAENTALAVKRLPPDLATWLAWLENTLASAVENMSPAPPLPAQPTTGAIYVDLPHGRMRVHRSGPPGDRPLLILSAPTTLQALAWQAGSPDRSTLVPELPGFGESDPLPSPTLEAATDALAAMLEQLGYAQVDLLAIGFATPLGCTLARRYPGAIARVILDGCYSLDEQEARTLAEQVAPVFPFDRGGGHIHRTWHMLRDGEAAWPWHDGSADAARGLAPILAARPLHDALLGVLKQPERYGDCARAALQSDEEARYPAFPQNALLLHRLGDRGYAGATNLAARLPRASLEERPANLTDTVQIVTHFLSKDAHVAEAVA